MRFVSLTVRNYRRHREQRVDFDRSRHLVGGPNESGKSTLAEALHRALFFRAKAGGEIREAMVSLRHAGHPEVEVEFEAAGSRWVLRKTFPGSAKGNTVLTEAAGRTWRDDEAEEQLGILTGVAAAGGKGAVKELAAAWPHLWVWQGRAGDHEAWESDSQAGSLVRRLQGAGVAAIVESDADQRTRERLAAEHARYFTDGGKDRKGGPLDLARVALEGAEAAREAAAEALRRLESDMRAAEDAETAIRAAEALLPGLRLELAEAEAALTNIESLRREAEDRKRLRDHAEQALAVLRRHHDAIVELEGRIAATREALAPQESMLRRLEAETSAARMERQRLDGLAVAAAETAREARRRREAAMAAETLTRFREEHERARRRADEAQVLAAARDEALSELAKLPALTDRDLEALRRKEAEAARAAATLTAAAAAVELLGGDLQVLLDGRAMAPGEPVILTDEAELAVGGARLRIRPGGGRTLEAARSEAANAAAAFEAGLARLGVSGPAEAAGVVERRRTWTEKAKQAEAGWKAMGGTAVAEEAARRRQDEEAAAARLERLRGDEPDISAEAAAESLAAAERQERETRAAAEAARAGAEAAERARDERSAAMEASRRELAALETTRGVRVEEHGEAAVRSERMAAAGAAADAAAAAHLAVCQALEDLAPAQREGDRDRLTRAIGVQEKQRREAEDALVAARARLRLDGSVDPRARAAEAEARAAEAQADFDREKQRAGALQLLREAFDEAREAIDRSLAEPLAARVAPYLQCVFGPGAAADFRLDGGKLEALGLVRGGAERFAFGQLSGGAKEQVAAAVRLAMAEVLAEAHDGCLPVIFDDAFAFADPSRVGGLVRMLDLAARNGLQVIVLTCTPGDYAALGAVETRLA